MKINSHNEWDKLREVVVGTAENMTVGLEFNPSQSVSPDLFAKACQAAKKALPEWYKEEVAEDLHDLCKILTDFGAEVFRPAPIKGEKLFSTPHWSASGKDIYNVRDLHIIIGDHVMVSPFVSRCRLYEPNAFADIWYHYFEQGFKWLMAPQPKLEGTYVVPYYPEGQEETTEEDILHRKLSDGRAEKYYRLTEDSILFDAANVVRFGKDLIYLISSTGNEKGARWLQSILGEEYRVHTTSTYKSSHIDSTIMPLRAGLVLLNEARVSPKSCPPILNSWNKVYFNDMASLPKEEIDFQSNVRDKVYKELKELGVDSDLNHISSPWAGINVLSLDQSTVLVHDRQKNLIKELEKHKLNVIPVRMRHCYTMLGGLHCSTLDTVREGKLENYFD